MEKEELVNNLFKIDEEVSLLFQPTNVKFKIVIVGGGALLLKGIISRATPDIDILTSYKEIDFILSKYNANSRVSAYSDMFPYNYEDRLEKVDIDTKTVEYYVVSTEDLIISKLFSFRDKDKDDIKNAIENKAINFKKLDEIVSSGEVKDACLSPNRYEQFLFNYERFKKETSK